MLTVPSFVASHTEAAVYIAGWYLFSLSISIYNKWMFGPSLDFHFPIIITAFHQLCLLVLSTGVLYVWPRFRPGAANVAAVAAPLASAGAGAGAGATGPSSASSSPTSSTPPPSVLAAAPPRSFLASCRIPWLVYLVHIVPCSLASAGDIGFSNVSFKYISLSLYTMLKTSSLMFVLLFGLLFRLEKFRWNLIIIVAVMTVSVLMMVSSPGEDASASADPDAAAAAAATAGAATGITLVLAASVMSGLRWSFTQLLLKHNEHTSNSIATIFYLSPAMSAILFAMGLVFEGWGNFLASPIWHLKGVLTTVVLMVVPGVMAFMMTVCEFKLLSVAPVITLSVAGIFKELLTILLSALIFGDRLSWLNCLGLVLTFVDIIWYNYYRYSQKEEYVVLPDHEDALEMTPLGHDEKNK
ncbi:hypothetical protein CAAN3_13S01068 [[Candida] anglica]